MKPWAITIAPCSYFTLTLTSTFTEPNDLHAHQYFDEMENTVLMRSLFFLSTVPLPSLQYNRQRLNWQNRGLGLVTNWSRELILTKEWRCQGFQGRKAHRSDSLWCKQKHIKSHAKLDTTDEHTQYSHHCSYKNTVPRRCRKTLSTFGNTDALLNLSSVRYKRLHKRKKSLNMHISRRKMFHSHERKCAISRELQASRRSCSCVDPRMFTKKEVKL